jgi:hypothetical protein
VVPWQQQFEGKPKTREMFAIFRRGLDSIKRRASCPRFVREEVRGRDYVYRVDLRCPEDLDETILEYQREARVHAAEPAAAAHAVRHHASRAEHLRIGERCRRRW